MEGNGSFMLLEICVSSAEGLQNVNNVTTMDVYAEISINGDPDTKQSTPVIKGCGPNPTWNFLVTYTMDLDALNEYYLLFHLKYHRMLGDRDIGMVQVPIKELFDCNNGDEKAEQNVIYSVGLPNGEAKGILKFSYKFEEMFNGTPVQQPPAALPPSGYQQASSHAPAQKPQKPHGGRVNEFFDAMDTGITVGNMAGYMVANDVGDRDGDVDVDDILSFF